MRERVLLGRAGELERWRLGERRPVSDVCCPALRYGEDPAERKEMLLAERDRECRNPRSLGEDDMEVGEEEQ